MIKKTSILTVSIVAVMAVATARADIASTTYVGAQVQSVESALSTHTGNNDIHVTTTDKNTWSGKQDAISDLATIRSGAEAGATAVQPSAIENMQTTGNMVTATTGTDFTSNLTSTEKYPSMKTAGQMITNSLSATTTSVTTLQNTYVKRTTGEGAGSETVPVYVASDGTATPITSYEGTSARATADASGNTITSTYATKTELGTKQDTLTTAQQNAVDSGITSTLVGKISSNESAITTLNGDSDVTGSVDKKIADALTDYSTTSQMNTALNLKYDADNPSGYQANVLEGVQVAGVDQTITSKKVNLGAAAGKSVDTSMTASSTSTNVPTTGAVAAFVSGYAAQGAEVNVQADWDQTTTTADDYIKNKPTLATVATSGNASDLTTDATHRLVTDDEKSTWNTKQAALTFDDAPTANSNNPVKSSGIKTALDAKANTTDLGALATKDTVANADIAADAAIAKSKLATDVQTSLGLADSALQPAGVTATGNNGVTAVATNGAITVTGVAATTGAAGVVQLADAAAVTAGTAGRVVDAAQLKSVADTASAAIPAPSLTQLASDGTLVLTAKQGTGNTVVYAWEGIGR